MHECHDRWMVTVWALGSRAQGLSLGQAIGRRSTVECQCVTETNIREWFKCIIDVVAVIYLVITNLIENKVLQLHPSNF